MGSMTQGVISKRLIERFTRHASLEYDLMTLPNKMEVSQSRDTQQNDADDADVDFTINFWVQFHKFASFASFC